MPGVNATGAELGVERSRPIVAAVVHRHRVCRRALPKGGRRPAPQCCGAPLIHYRRPPPVERARANPNKTMPRGSKCLRALRAHMIATPSAPPEIVDGEVVTASGKFACDAPTGYRSSRSGAGVYSLEAVVLLLRTAKSSDYLKACLAKKLQNVVLGDQSDLKAYLTGAAADSAQLEDDDADDDDVERKKSKKTNFVSNDRSGHDDQNAY